MMSISDYMVESTAYPLHLDHHITDPLLDPPIHLYTQRIRRPFIYANIIQKMTSWKCPPCGTGILRDFISLMARPIISNNRENVLNVATSRSFPNTKKELRRNFFN
ncbi:hypothetical protein AVEN_60079-1 [Araneus ventricosus]|uniref:Uncharacterized protein n=1 Tax=Araneus ventricosus TaxID=182803 RepID=A0A4Y2HZW9_ARAVE|nr:hypothetical protein AVEN_60079-1 [Araneus ventricosus]